MSLLEFNFILLLFSIGKVRANFAVESFAPRKVHIIPTRTYLCEGTQPAIPFVINLRNINDNGDKVQDMEFELDVDFNEKWQLTVVIDKWNNGDWDNDFYTAEDTACHLMTKYMRKTWENLRKQIVPTIPEKCLIQPGSYKLTDFKIKSEDMNLPIAVLGAYRVTAKLRDDENEEILCQVLEIEVQKP